MTGVDKLDTPCVTIDLDRLAANIARVQPPVAGAGAPTGRTSRRIRSRRSPRCRSPRGAQPASTLPEGQRGRGLARVADGILVDASSDRCRRRQVGRLMVAEAVPRLERRRRQRRGARRASRRRRSRRGASAGSRRMRHRLRPQRRAARSPTALPRPPSPSELPGAARRRCWSSRTADAGFRRSGVPTPAPLESPAATALADLADYPMMTEQRAGTSRQLPYDDARRRDGEAVLDVTGQRARRRSRDHRRRRLAGTAREPA